MAKSNRYFDAQFLISAAKLQQLPADEGVEVAFAGRSNAGKSSALNRLTNNRHLAFTSKTPGRTQLLNLFTLGAVEEQKRLVDLPGYGYAKVPISVKLGWQKTLTAYLQTRRCLKGLVILMDIRHPLKDLDIDLLTWTAKSPLALHVLLTKADKLKRSQANAALLQVKRHLTSYHRPISVQLFSALKMQGIDELRAQLDLWFGDELIVDP